LIELVKFIDKCLAPGTYCPEKTRLDSTPQFTFGLKMLLDKPNDTPGMIYEKTIQKNKKLN